MARAILSHDPELGTTLTMPVAHGTEPDDLDTLLATTGWAWDNTWCQWRRLDTENRPADPAALAAYRARVADLTDWDVDTHADDTAPTGDHLDPDTLDTITPGDWVRCQDVDLTHGFVLLGLVAPIARTDTGDPWRQVHQLGNTTDPVVVLIDPAYLDADDAAATFTVPATILTGHHPTH